MCFNKPSKCFWCMLKSVMADSTWENSSGYWPALCTCYFALESKTPTSARALSCVDSELQFSLVLLYPSIHSSFTFYSQSWINPSTSLHSFSTSESQYCWNIPPCIYFLGFFCCFFSFIFWHFSRVWGRKEVKLCGQFAILNHKYSHF